MSTLIQGLSEAQIAIGLRIADLAAFADVTEGSRPMIVFTDGALTPAWDTRSLLSSVRHCDEVREMNLQALEWTIARGLLRQLPDRPYLVIEPRETARPAAAVAGIDAEVDGGQHC